MRISPKDYRARGFVWKHIDEKFWVETFDVSSARQVLLREIKLFLYKSWFIFKDLLIRSDQKVLKVENLLVRILKFTSKSYTSRSRENIFRLCRGLRTSRLSLTKKKKYLPWKGVKFLSNFNFVVVKIKFRYFWPGDNSKIVGEI